MTRQVYGSRITRQLVLLVIVSGLALGWAAPAAADGIIIPYPPCGPTPLCYDCPPPRIPPPPCPPQPPPPARLSIKYHRVTVTIENQLAVTHIDQVFINEENYQVEGIYMFPLPADATVSQFAMWVDGKKMDGQVLDRSQARRIYEDIVRSQRDPALLEYVDRGAFQASIFPIPPKGERRIEIEYSQVLVADQGLIHYSYPLNTEKFSARPLEQVSVDVHLKSQDAIKAIYSPSHSVAVSRNGDYEARAGYEESNVKPDRDFDLYYSVSQDTIGLNLITYNDNTEDGFFVLLAAPQVTVEQDQVVSKDVIAVIDTSGSMDGDKLRQAKDALRFILDHLNPEDRFNIVRFSTDVQSYATGLRPATEREEGKRFIDGLRAAGNTDINRALLEALNSADKERPTILIFLTDGVPTTGEIKADRIIANVKQVIRPNVRLFAFGLGDDVNTYLLDMLAQENRGVAAYVRPGQKIDEQVSAFYAKVSTPVLADIQIDFGDMGVYDVYPEPLPDLFIGTQLMLVGRYHPQFQVGRPLINQITLRGTVNGQEQTFTYPLPENFNFGPGPAFIPRLWATRKIGYLLTQIRLYGESKELVQQIVDLAVKYGIVTPYTSFLVNETRLLTDADRQKIVQSQQSALPTLMPGMGGQGGGGVGAPAVDASQNQQRLYSAEQSPGVAGQQAAQQIRIAGTKTFIQQAGVWIDTTFDPSRMKPVEVGFGSEDYFKLIAARPEWGQYFAQGTLVIVVLDGQAYKTVPGAGQTITIPATVTPAPQATPVSQAATPQPASTSTPQPAGAPSPGGGLCASAALAWAVALLAVGRHTRRTQNQQSK